MSLMNLPTAVHPTHRPYSNAIGGEQQSTGVVSGSPPIGGRQGAGPVLSNSETIFIAGTNNLPGTSLLPPPGSGGVPETASSSGAAAAAASPTMNTLTTPLWNGNEFTSPVVLIVVAVIVVLVLMASR
jgi:hypothetical protein